MRLQPLVSSRIQRLDNDRSRVFDLIRGLGSPLNVVFPEQILENVESFLAVYRRHHLSGHVLFAHKTNQSDALVRQLTTSSAGVEVASFAELQHALSCGIRREKIVAGGPKTPEYIRLAATAGVRINADSLAELDVLASGHWLETLDVTIRLSGFRSSGGVTSNLKPSRFGIDCAQFDEALSYFERHDSAIKLRGAAFHLDTTSIPEKVLAAEASIELIDSARERGHDPQVLNIGGGFKAGYLRHADEWHTYTTALRDAALGDRPPLTWNENNFGLRRDGDVLRGNLNLYEYYDDTTSSAYLDALLSEPTPVEKRPLSGLILDNLLELEIEPGRALADQCGVTLARVLEVRPYQDSYLVRLDMNRRDLSIEDSEFLVDPLMFSASGNNTANSDGDVPVFFIGNLCLEADFITRRTVFLPALPDVGDIAMFVNTAGYLSDFSASNAIRQPNARRIAMFDDGSDLAWTMDDGYSPTMEKVLVS